MPSAAHIDPPKSENEISVAEGAGTPKLKILVLDDDFTCRCALRQMITRLGHETLEAESGLAALEIFRNEHPDLLLLDIHMPEIDGIDFLSALRGAENTTPVITMSGGGHFPPGVILRSTLMLGAQHMLPKPFSGDELDLAIREAMGPNRPCVPDAA